MKRLSTSIASVSTVIAFFFCLSLSPAFGDGPPKGPVILTISGNITNPDRGELSDFDDAYFSSHDISFDKAATFDHARLEALGMHTIRVHYPDWPRGYEFEGPRLIDVLSAAGASGSTVLVKALDGYAPEIEVEDFRKYTVILALKRDGKYLGIGDHGPAWVIYPRDDNPQLSDTDDANWVWSVFYMEVK